MSDPSQNRGPQRPRPGKQVGLSKVPPIRKQYAAPLGSTPDEIGKQLPEMTPPAVDNETRKFLSVTGSLLGFGDRDYAFGPFPRGYGLTVTSLVGCYGLLRWQKNKIDKSKRKPPFTSTNVWFSKLKNMEKEYAMARNDFPRTVMLLLIGGLGMPYTAAVGALFWCAGRATDFHEAEESRHGNERTEAVLCRFGKFLMICGVAKFFVDFARGKVNGILSD